MKILNIVAHLDDVEIWFGGTILKHIARGDKCSTISFASKNDKRRGEAIRSHKFMKCELKILDLNIFEDIREIIKTLEEEIEKEAPDIVISHWWNDSHPDHRQIFLLTQKAIIIPWIKTGKPCSFLVCDTYNSQGLFSCFEPNVYVDVGKVWSKKIKAIEHYKSQPVKIWKNMALKQARFYGQRVNSSYCEVFRKVPIQGTLGSQKYLK